MKKKRNKQRELYEKAGVNLNLFVIFQKTITSINRCTAIIILAIFCEHKVIPRS